MLRKAEPVLTVAQMREAEAKAAPNSDALYELMERAGAAVADIAWRVAAGSEILVTCGPGNNGGDGYVAARILRERGAKIQVMSFYEPKSELALRAAAKWNGPVESADGWHSNRDAVLVDAVFGTGTNQRFEADDCEFLALIGRQVRRVISVDLPSGLEADSGNFNVDVPTRTLKADITLALGALKCAHILPGAEAECGEIRVVDIGLNLGSWPVRTLGRPALRQLPIDVHKYSRGMVAVVAGEMQGAANLVAMAAAHAGAGYVEILGGNGQSTLSSIVHRALTEEALEDERIGAVVIGPGLGRGAEAKRWVDFLVRKTRRNLVIDADALHLVDPADLVDRLGQTILTPHAGEFMAMRKRTGVPVRETSSLIDRLRADFDALGMGGHAVLVRKGPTTYLANGKEQRFALRGNRWLSSAGTGDVLSGVIAAMLADNPGDAMAAASAGVWLHSTAADQLGSCFVADELAFALKAARASL